MRRAPKPTPPSPAIPCPDKAVLEQLLTGQLPDEMTALSATHVEGCERCSEVLASLAGDRAHVRRGGRERRLVPGTRAKPRSRPWFWAMIAAAVALGAIIAFQHVRAPQVVELPPPQLQPAAQSPSVRAFTRAGDELRELTEKTAALPVGARVRLALDSLVGFEVVALACRGATAEVLWPTGGTQSQRFRPSDRGFLAADVVVAGPSPPHLVVLAGPSAIPPRANTAACTIAATNSAARLWPNATFEWRQEITLAR